MIRADSGAMRQLLGDGVTADGVIVFDASCGFCAGVVSILLKAVAPHEVYVCSTRSYKARMLETDPTAHREVFSLVTPVMIATDVDAYITIFAMGRCTRLLGRIVGVVPRVLSAATYDFVARNRGLMSRLFGLRGLPKLVRCRLVEDGL
jgi:predicted DCC family thiol-disulfide oxidoreductase YuxK